MSNSKFFTDTTKLWLREHGRVDDTEYTKLTNMLELRYIDKEIFFVRSIRAFIKDISTIKIILQATTNRDSPEIRNIGFGMLGFTKNCRYISQLRIRDYDLYEEIAVFLGNNSIDQEWFNSLDTVINTNEDIDSFLQILFGYVGIQDIVKFQEGIDSVIGILSHYNRKFSVFQMLSPDPVFAFLKTDALFMAPEEFMCTNGHIPFLDKVSSMFVSFIRTHWTHTMSMNWRHSHLYTTFSRRILFLWRMFSKNNHCILHLFSCLSYITLSMCSSVCWTG